MHLLHIRNAYVDTSSALHNVQVNSKVKAQDEKYQFSLSTAIHLF